MVTEDFIYQGICWKTKVSGNRLSNKFSDLMEVTRRGGFLKILLWLIRRKDWNSNGGREFGCKGSHSERVNNLEKKWVQQNKRSDFKKQTSIDSGTCQWGLLGNSLREKRSAGKLAVAGKKNYNSRHNSKLSQYKRKTRNIVRPIWPHQGLFTVWFSGHQLYKR